MDKRPYNIFFDLHTVSGIVLSVLCYVIFFAGSFAFFRDEIINWERNEIPTAKKALTVDFDYTIDSLAKKNNLYGRDIVIWKGYEEKRVMMDVSASKDSTVKGEVGFFYLNPETQKKYQYETSYTLGEFLYRLHFFAQVPYPAGYYLSGFTALFLFFIILTGFLVHWKKLVQNFFVFRPWAKLKTVWTDAHTVLGTIGLPFQAVYAITGAFFMINAILVIPVVSLFYNGDEDRFYDDLGYGHPKFEFQQKRINNIPSINELAAKTTAKWEDFAVTEVHIFNYGDSSMHIDVSGELDNATKFTGLGSVIYRGATGEVVETKDPYARTSYLASVKSILYKIHFGDYGGYTLRIVSFVLGLLSCFVVVTGILIWLEARNKKNIPEKKKAFNRWVGHIFLALCLTMFPVTALAFIVTKLLPADLASQRMDILYTGYFTVWVVMSVGFMLKRDNYFTNKYTLLSGGILGLIIPLTSGITTGNWLGLTGPQAVTDFFVVDTLWIVLSAMAIYAALIAKRRTSDAIVAADTDEE